MLQLGNDVVEEVEEGGNEPSEDEDDLVDMVLQSPLDQYLDPCNSLNTNLLILYSILKLQ